MSQSHLDAQMGDPALRQELLIAREQLDAALTDLEGAARSTLQLPFWIRRRPYAWACGAFLVGFGLGLLPDAPRTRRRV